MKVFPINNSQQIFENQQKHDDIKRRLTILGSGFAIGTLGGLAYFSSKKMPARNLWIKSLETGAAAGLASDILDMVIQIPKNVKKAENKETKLDNELLKNKEFFIAVYTNDNSKFKDVERYQKALNDKKFCNEIFKNKEILKASQEALIDINQKKIEELKLTGDIKKAGELEVVNQLLQKGVNAGVNKGVNNREIEVRPSDNHEGVAFKSIFDFFHSSGESMKKRAEISVNRYASSAAAAAGVLANTGVGDTLALTIITKNMCKKVFKIYDCSGGYTSALIAVAVGSVLGTNLASKGLTMFPGAGNAVNATITYTLHQLEGRALIEFLEDNADSLSGMSDADAVSKFGYRVKLGLKTIQNEKVREILEKAIDAGFDLFL